MSDQRLTGTRPTGSAWIGVNVASSKYCYNNWHYKNWMKQADKWYEYSYSGTTDFCSRSDPDGYPTGLSSTGQYLFCEVQATNLPTTNYAFPLWRPNYPPLGWYTLLWTGAGRLEVSGAGTSVIATGTRLDGTNYCYFDNTQGNVSLYLYSMSTGNHPRNMRLYELKYETEKNHTHPYYDEFLATLDGFSPLRWNIYAISNDMRSGDNYPSFDDFPATTYYTYADGVGPRSLWNAQLDPSGVGKGLQAGAPWEVQVEIANLLSSDLWVNVPYYFTDADVTGLALKFTDLDNKLWVEYGSEMFIGGNYAVEDQYAWCTASGLAMGADPGRAAGTYIHHRSRQVHDIFSNIIKWKGPPSEETLQNRGNKVVKVISYFRWGTPCQYQEDWYTGVHPFLVGLDYAQGSSLPFDYLAFNHYAGPYINGSNYSGTFINYSEHDLANAVFSGLSNSENNIQSLIDEIALSGYVGLKYCTYEGAPKIVMDWRECPAGGFGEAFDHKFGAANRSQTMYWAGVRWVQSGKKLLPDGPLMYYQSTTPITRFDSFGFGDSFTLTGFWHRPRYAALREFEPAKDWYKRYLTVRQTFGLPSGFYFYGTGRIPASAQPKAKTFDKYYTNLYYLGLPFTDLENVSIHSPNPCLMAGNPITGYSGSILVTGDGIQWPFLCGPGTTRVTYYQRDNCTGHISEWNRIEQDIVGDGKPRIYKFIATPSENGPVEVSGFTTQSYISRSCRSSIARLISGEAGRVHDMDSKVPPGMCWNYQLNGAESNSKVEVGCSPYLYTLYASLYWPSMYATYSGWLQEQARRALASMETHRWVPPTFFGGVQKLQGTADVYKFMPALGLLGEHTGVQELIRNLNAAHLDEAGWENYYQFGRSGYYCATYLFDQVGGAVTPVRYDFGSAANDELAGDNYRVSRIAAALASAGYGTTGQLAQDLLVPALHATYKELAQANTRLAADVLTRDGISHSPTSHDDYHFLWTYGGNVLKNAIEVYEYGNTSYADRAVIFDYIVPILDYMEPRVRLAIKDGSYLWQGASNVIGAYGWAYRRNVEHSYKYSTTTGTRNYSGTYQSGIEALMLGAFDEHGNVYEPSCHYYTHVGDSVIGPPGPPSDFLRALAMVPQWNISKFYLVLTSTIQTYGGYGPGYPKNIHADRLTSDGEIESVRQMIQSLRYLDGYLE